MMVNPASWDRRTSSFLAPTHSGDEHRPLPPGCSRIPPTGFVPVFIFVRAMPDYSNATSGRQVAAPALPRTPSYASGLRYRSTANNRHAVLRSPDCRPHQDAMLAPTRPRHRSRPVPGLRGARAVPESGRRTMNSLPRPTPAPRFDGSVVQLEPSPRTRRQPTPGPLSTAPPASPSRTSRRCAVNARRSVDADAGVATRPRPHPHPPLSPARRP